MKYTKEEIAESKAHLKAIFEPIIKSTNKRDDLPIIRAIIRSVSRSGMTRKMDFYFIKEDKQTYLNYHISRATHFSRDKDGHLVVGGCGMDMVFKVVYGLGLALWGYGPGSDAEKLGYHSGRNGMKTPECDGGYLLKHEVL